MLASNVGCIEGSAFGLNKGYVLGIKENPLLGDVLTSTCVGTGVGLNDKLEILGNDEEMALEPIDGFTLELSNGTLLGLREGMTLGEVKGNVDGMALDTTTTGNVDGFKLNEIVGRIEGMTLGALVICNVGSIEGPAFGVIEGYLLGMKDFFSLG